MRSGMIAFAAGVIAIGLCGTLPEQRYLVFLIVILMLGCWLCRKRHSPLKISIVCSLLFVLGAFWHIANAQYRLQQRIPVDMEGVDFLVRGYVASLPEYGEISQQFMFYIESAPNGFERRKILLNYYGAEPIHVAQRWQFQIRLKRPHGFSNAGTFDYEAWLLQQGVAGKGYVRESEANQSVGSRKQSVLGIRDRLKNRILKSTEGLKQQSIILALAIGDRSLISEQQWRLFSQSGTNHLIVVSGLHVGFIAGLCFFCGCWTSGKNF